MSDLDNDAPTLPLDPNTDTCENCAFAEFKPNMTWGVCKINPPVPLVLQVEKEKQILTEVKYEQVIQGVWPPVGRNSFCYAFEPKEPATVH